jgi:excisionase family DNA binding protein
LLPDANEHGEAAVDRRDQAAVKPSDKVAANPSDKVAGKHRDKVAVKRRAFSIDEICERNGVGRTTLYAEIKDKRLKVRKVRRRTIITAEAEDDWLSALPEGGEETVA